MIRYEAFAFALIIGVLTGCATIMHGNMQSVSITSTPVGATVTVDHRVVGTTPVSAELTRKNVHLVQISLEGYKTATLVLERKSSVFYWGNLILGGWFIGMAVDAITGAMYRLEPEHVAETLAPDESTALEDGRFYVITVLHPRPDWEKIGQLEPE